MSKKNLALKRWLAKRNRRNRRLPVFVVLRTRGEVANNKFRRYWRRDKLMTRNMRLKMGKKDKAKAY